MSCNESGNIGANTFGTAAAADMQSPTVLAALHMLPRKFSIHKLAVQAVREEDVVHRKVAAELKKLDGMEAKEQRLLARANLSTLALQGTDLREESQLYQVIQYYGYVCGCGCGFVWVCMCSMSHIDCTPKAMIRVRPCCLIRSLSIMVTYECICTITQIEFQVGDSRGLICIHVYVL